MLKPLKNPFEVTKLNRKEDLLQAEFEFTQLFKTFCLNQEFLSFIYSTNKPFKNFSTIFFLLGLKSCLPVIYNFFSPGLYYRGICIFFTIENISSGEMKIETFKANYQKINESNNFQSSSFVSHFIVLFEEGIIKRTLIIEQSFTEKKVWIEEVYPTGLFEKIFFFDNIFNEECWLNEVKRILFEEEEDLESIISDLDINFFNKGDEKELFNKKEEKELSPQLKTESKEMEGRSKFVIWIWVAAGGLLLSTLFKGCSNSLAGKNFNYGTDDVGSVFGGLIILVAFVLIFLYLISRNSSR